MPASGATAAHMGTDVCTLAVDKRCLKGKTSPARMGSIADLLIRACVLAGACMVTTSTQHDAKDVDNSNACTVNVD